MAAGFDLFRLLSPELLESVSLNRRSLVATVWLLEAFSGIMNV